MNQGDNKIYSDGYSIQIVEVDQDSQRFLVVNSIGQYSCYEFPAMKRISDWVNSYSDITDWRTLDAQ